MKKYNIDNCVEYIVYKMIEWSIETDSNAFNISKIKVLKIIFFLAMAENHDSRNKITDIFKNWKFGQYGIFSEDAYKSLKHKYDCAEFDNMGSSLTMYRYPCDKVKINKSAKSIIDNAFDSLKILSPNMIKYTSSDIIDMVLMQSQSKIDMACKGVFKYSYINTDISNYINSEIIFKREYIENKYI